MKVASCRIQVFRLCANFGVIVLISAQAFCAVAQDRGEKLRRFEADRKACLGGRSSQSFDSCMREANAVLSQRQEPTPPVSADQLERNRLMRCEVQTGADYAPCQSRVRGEGTVSGSVGGGGILRELVTREVVAGPTPQEQTKSGN